MRFSRYVSVSHALGISLSVISTFPWAQAAFAQDESERWTALRACLQIEPDAARLACFEGIVADAPAISDPAEPATAENKEATTLAARATESTQTPQSTQPNVATTSAAEVTAAESQSDTDTARTTQGRRGGHEDDNARTVTIVEMRAPSPRDATFVTEGGQVFVQTSGSTRGRYPPVPFEAVLEDGAFGSLFLATGARGPRVRVAERD